MADRFEVPIRFGRIWLHTAGSIFLMTAFWWLRRRNDPVVFYFAAGVVTLILIWLARVLSTHGPGLLVNSAGICARSAVGFSDPVSWNDIAAVTLKFVAVNWYLVFLLRDTDAFIKRYGPLRRWYMYLSFSSFGSPVQVSTTYLECDKNELLAKVIAIGTRHGLPKFGT